MKNQHIRASRKGKEKRFPKKNRRICKRSSSQTEFQWVEGMKKNLGLRNERVWGSMDRDGRERGDELKECMWRMG